MTRQRVRLRPIDEAQLAGTAAIWELIRQAARPAAQSVTVEAVLDRIRTRMEASARGTEQGRPETYVLTTAVGEDDEPVGLVSVSAVDDSLFALSRLVVIDALHVAPEHRRHGIGRDLLLEALDFATRLGAEEIAVQTPQHTRELNRFFSDWGFAPGVVRRSTPVAALGRRLGVDIGTEPAAEAAALSHMQRLLRRRAVLVGRTSRTGRPVRVAR